MKYAEEVDMADDDDEYAVDDNGDNEPLGEGDGNDDDE